MDLKDVSLANTTKKMKIQPSAPNMENIYTRGALVSNVSNLEYVMAKEQITALSIQIDELWNQRNKLEEVVSVYKMEQRMKDRECMYCASLFDCKNPKETEYCINFEARNNECQKRYKEWRDAQGKNN